MLWGRKISVIKRFFSSNTEVLPSSFITSRLLLKEVIWCYKEGSSKTVACKAACLALRCTIGSYVNDMQGWHYTFLLETY